MSLASGVGRALILNDPSKLLGADAAGVVGPASSSSSSIPLNAFATTNDIIVKVHPMVLFAVLDHYLRRPEGQTRVIGTLLGSVTGNVVEVTNSFAVPHQEKKDDEVAVGKDFNKQMLALHQRVTTREKIIGWYATTFEGSPINNHSSLIHEFYTTECDQPVHLVVDTSLTGDSVGCRAYISSPLQVDGESLADMFHEIVVKLESSEAEKICIDRMVKGQEAPFETRDGLAVVDSQMANLESSMVRLQEMLTEACEYVDKVVSGEIEADEDLGRQIGDTLTAVPRMRPEVFAKVFDDNLQDLLVVSYLSSLTRTQLAIAEKLTA